jgi:transposase
MARIMLTDKLWSKLKIMMKHFGIYNKPGLRLTVEGIFYRLRVGCPWRDLPACFGNWNSIYKQFNRWSARNKLINIFQALVEQPDLEWLFIDGSISKAHQHSAGAYSGQDQAIGKSRGGHSTKMIMAVDAFGLPIHFSVTGGHVHEMKSAGSLIEALPQSDYLIADKGYNSEPMRQRLREQGITPVIPRHANSTIGNDDIDWHLYKQRHLVENLFARIKHFRAIATRYDKLKRNFVAMIALACSFLWLPM